MGKKAPKPPDYAAAAEQTAIADQDAARYATYANRVDQNNPWGSVNYESYIDTDPATGEEVTRWRENTTLNDQSQAALDAQMGLLQGRSELAGSMMGDLQGDYGERMNFDQYGQPIGMGGLGGVSGAGGGISNMSLAGLPEYQRQQLQESLDYGGAPDVNAPEWTREAAEKSVYDRGASRLDPQIAQESEALDVRLRSQGLNPGDEAYDAQMNSFNQRKTDAYDALNASAMQEGARQAESMFGMESQFRDQSTGEQDRMGDFFNNAAMGQMGADLAARLGEGGMRAQQTALNNAGQAQGFGQRMQQVGYNNDQAYRANALANSLRSQGMNEDMQQRAYRLNEVNSLLSGQQVNAPQFGSYAQQGQTGGADYLGAAGTQYEADMAQYGANQAMMNSIMSGLGQGAGMMAMSDRRLKRNIKKIGEINGTNWYEFDYIWGEHAVGVMADEVPHAASMHPSGYLMVDYSKV